MKLNPEALVIETFALDTGADLAQVTLGPVDAAALAGPYQPLDPTPNSRCFVCE
jgi:hypothetical protein